MLVPNAFRRKAVPSLFQVELFSQLCALLLSQGLFLQGAQQLDAISRDWLEPAAREELGVGLLQERPRIVPAHSRAGVVAVASPRLRIEVRAAKDERAIAPALFHHFESVHVPVPEKEDPLEQRKVPGEEAYLDPGGLAALRAQDAGPAELVGDIAVSAFLNPMEREPDVPDTEGDGFDRAPERSVPQRDAAGRSARTSWMRRSSSADFSGLA